MKIVVFGAGVQGTVFAVKLARAGHAVNLIATPRRALELIRFGATIQNAETHEILSAEVTVLEQLTPELEADLCLVTVRREQLDAAIPLLAAATRIARFVFLVNHANGSEQLFSALGRSRVVLAFPGIAGRSLDGIISYVPVDAQNTAVERSAGGVADLFEQAGFAVDRISDLDSWLRRHAVFILAVAGALYENGCDPGKLAGNPRAVRRTILAIREGWAALDRRHVAPAPFALRFIFSVAPLWFSVRYWSRLLASPRGELYFAAHVRHAPSEMAALTSDVMSFLDPAEAPQLLQLLEAIRQAARVMPA